jgi:hypothetical protein
LHTRTFFDDTQLISVGENGFSYFGTGPHSCILGELIIG